MTTLRPATLFASIALALSLAVGGLWPAQPAEAAVYWSAREMIRSDVGTVVMTPGESSEFTIAFKNTGQATWTSQGSRFVSAYTYDPKYRNSTFADNSWMSVEQPARLLEESVPPGGIGRVKFMLYAPMEAGIYRETFRLAAENTAWLDGGQFSIDIEVTDNPGNPALGFRAIKLMVSENDLRIKAGETKSFRVAYKNIGRKVWQDGGNYPLQLVAQPGNAYTFRDSSWNGEVAANLMAPEIAPGQLSFFDLKLTAPRSNGNYTAAFSLAAGAHNIYGGQIDIPIEVYGFSPTPPSSSTSGSGSGSYSGSFLKVYEEDLSNDGPKGPNIRIGLLRPEANMVRLTATGAYTLRDGNHNDVRQLSGVTTAVFDPASRQYTVTNGSYVFRTDKHVHFTPMNTDTTVFEILSYENRPSWDTSINFNKFRGDISFHFVPGTGELWLIEELPVEDYMRGLAETSNGSPFEYQKALVTAARTYALYIKLIGGKHKNNFFDLNTTGWDQVYKGYSSELVRPKLVEAVEATRGKVVTYNGEIVVTPYFSRSDGRTRAWTEVWSRRVHPWLVSVPTPYDSGLDLWGHGVGLSANDAYGRAKHDGASWTDILKYYYTGVEIREMY